MIARWWSARTARERQLLASAGALAAAFLLWFGLAAPAMTAHERAERAYAAAVDLYREMSDGARQAGRLRASAPEAETAPDQPLRAAASASARDLGLEISRIQPGEGGSLAFVFEAADPQDLFLWMEALQTRYGASAGAVTIRRNDAGATVQANILLLEAQ